METADVLLGYRYYLRGEVLHGKQLGRTLGMPTVNQRFADGCVTPAHGVYYTTAEIDGRIYPAVSNVGTRPTVSTGDAVDLETHILHYSGDLYGKTVTVRFHAHGRAETKFADVAALRDAVMRDIAAAAAYFEREGIE